MYKSNNFKPVANKQFTKFCGFVNMAYGTDDNLLTQVEFFAVARQPCNYCGEQEISRTVAKINKHSAYKTGNIVSICQACLKILGATPEEKVPHLAKIVEHLQTTGGE